MSYKIIVSLILAVTLTGCSSTPTNPEFWMEKEINSCLPTAIIFKKSLNKYEVWSEVFRYSWKDEKGKLRGHAMVAYLYPQGQNQLWTYDSMGSYRIRAYTNNVTDVAQKSHNARGWTNKVFAAEYLK